MCTVIVEFILFSASSVLERALKEISESIQPFDSNYTEELF